MAKSALAGLLAILLLAVAMLSVNHALHQALHQDGAGGNHLCAVCSLVKGQVSVTETAMVFGFALVFFLFSLRLADKSCLPGFDYSLSPSRAPPQR